MNESVAPQLTRALWDIDHKVSGMVKRMGMEVSNLSPKVLHIMWSLASVFPLMEVGDFPFTPFETFDGLILLTLWSQ
jgi:hypothetical protein